MTDVLQSSITVEHNGETYEFLIPGYADEIRIGIKERDIRRQLDPQMRGMPDGLDVETTFLIRNAAIFEVLLTKSSATWPFSAGAEGKPVVDHTKWAKDKVLEATNVGAGFETQLRRFRVPGSADGNGAGTETVAS